MNQRPTYRSEIDGLRAVAVVPVVLFHGGVRWFSGGYVGVDVFFVISGFLITSILLAELEGESFSIARFYERRARRIFPALFVVMVAAFAMGWMWMTPRQLTDLSGATLAVVVFASNILFWQRTDYFAPAAEENPLLHTWSLAAEEQFYLAFPVVLFLAWRRGPRFSMGVTIVASVLSFALCEWASRVMPVANFYLLPFRAWELGAGAVCAFLLQHRPARPSHALSLLGLVMVVGPALLYDDATRVPSLYALAPVLGTALVILFATERTAVGRVLSTPLLVGIGLISYSAYLWHQPLFAFARIRDAVGNPVPEVAFGLVVLSFVLGATTWKFVEQPFRKGGRFGDAPQARVFATTALGSLALAAVAVPGIVTQGFHDVWLSRHSERRETLRVIERAVDSRRVLADGECGFNVEGFDARTAERILECRQRVGASVLVLGDSHSLDVYNGLVMNRAFGDQKTVGIYCRIHTDRECAESLMRFLERHPTAFDRILYTQAGFHLLRTTGGRSGRTYIAGIPLDSPINESDFEVADESVDEVSDYLQRLSTMTNVVWLGSRLEPHISQAAILQRTCAGKFRLRPGQRELYLRLDESMRRRSEGAGYAFVSQQSPKLFNEDMDFINCDVWYWRDGDHWSMDGSRLFVARLIEEGLLR